MSAMFPTKSLKSYRGRGQVYSWLRAHHDAVAERLANEETTWAALAAEIASHGVSGRRGDPPTANAVLKVWRRVRTDLRKAADAEDAKRAQRAAHPSRMSPNWRPQEVPPPTRPSLAPRLPSISAANAVPTARPATPVPHPAQQTGSRSLMPFVETRTQEEIDAHVRKQEAAMDEMFAKHDRKYRFFGGG